MSAPRTARADRGRHELVRGLPIDARKMKFDALIAASGKCLEGVPGMGFVFLRKAILDGCAGQSQSLAMDLHDQYTYMEKTGQWRFTPPTHVVVALAEAIAQFVEPKAGSPRGWRATPPTTAR
jgi:2-aminoethylphosphonate-pyruvate transaminase